MRSKLFLKTLCVGFLLMTGVGMTYGGSAKTTDQQDYGVPFFRLVVDGGFVNPFIGVGGMLELPNLFGFLTAGVSAYYGPDIFEMKPETTINGVAYYDGMLGVLGFPGLYLGAKVGWIFSQEKEMETQAIPVFSHSVGYNYYMTYSYPEEIPVYYRHLLVGELTLEQTGGNAILAYSSSYSDDLEFYVAPGMKTMLKVMYQFEYIYNCRVDYKYTLGSGSWHEGSYTRNEYLKVFIGPMATLDLSGIGGYCGMEMGVDHIYFRTEIGAVWFGESRPTYVPFKCNFGFYL